MKTRQIILGMLIFFMAVSPAYATPDLYSWMFNIDGVVTEYVNEYDTSGMPVNAALGPNDLGIFTYRVATQGAHSFIGYFDYEFDEAQNTFFNERGSVSGSPGAGMSWQIDTIDNLAAGNIFDNVYDNTLNNSNMIPDEGDVSWAMGWDYFLEANQAAVIHLVVSAVMPDAGFFLTHTDNDTGESIYFSGILDIQPVPEPQSLALLGLGCVMLFLARGMSSRFQNRKGKYIAGNM